MNNTLQNAIITALHTQYKYEAPAVFDIIKRAGYETRKQNGYWMVRNPETYKVIYLTCYGNYVCVGNRRIDVERLPKVDIVNYLNKPQNREYYNDNTGWNTPTKRKVSDLRWAKRRVANCEADIERLSKELERARQRYTQATKELLTLQAQNGLLK